MAECFYEGVSRRGNACWGSWIGEGNEIENSIIHHCRRVFKKKYKNLWIDPIYFDDSYYRFTNEFFKEVGVALYPKGKDSDKIIAKAIAEEVKYLETIYGKEARKHVNVDALVWSIAQEDIEKAKNKGVKPVCVIIKGVRFSDKKCEGGYREKIVSVSEVGLKAFLALVSKL